MRNLYVNQLDENLQTQIEKELRDYFKEELDLSQEETEEELELAMNSRVSDLEDTINIKNIIT